MSTMAGNLYMALKDAGAKEDLAIKAAEEATANDREIATLKSDINLIKWMLGFNLVMTSAILKILYISLPGYFRSPL